MATTAALNRSVILTQCRVTAERRLAEALEPLLEAAAVLLAELGQNAKDMAEREQLHVGASRLRSHRDAYHAGFRKGFGERFDASARALLRGGPGWEELDRETAAMLRTNVLENEVAIIKLGVRLKEVTREELAGLTGRLVTLFKLHELDDGDNPLGPGAVAHGVYAGLVAARVEGRAARALRPLLEDRLAGPVRELYRALNQVLDALGVAPHAGPRGGSPPAAPPPAAPPAAAQRVSAPSAPAAAVTAAGAAAAAPVVSIAAETAAARKLVSVIRDRAVPEALLPFLRRTWVRVLALAYEAGGEQGEAWAGAVRTLEDLLWSIEAKPDAAARNRLRSLIPDLLRRIDAGLAGVTLPADERREVLDTLMGLHRALLQEPGR